MQATIDWRVLYASIVKEHVDSLYLDVVPVNLLEMLTNLLCSKGSWTRRSDDKQHEPRVDHDQEVAPVLWGRHYIWPKTNMETVLRSAANRRLAKQSKSSHDTLYAVHDCVVQMQDNLNRVMGNIAQLPDTIKSARIDAFHANENRQSTSPPLRNS